MSNEEEIINQEGYFSLIGNFLTTILTGNSLYLIYFSHYIFKQLTEIEPELSENFIYIFIGIVITFTNLSNLFSNYFFNDLNIRLIVLITYLFLLSAHSLFYYSTYVYFIIIAFIFYGIGNGICYYPLMKNINIFFPQYKNIISLLNLFFYSLSPLLFHFISNKIISNNPEIGVKKVLKLEIILYLIFGILSFFFSFDSKEIKKNGVNKKIISEEIPLNNIQRINTINKEVESSTENSRRDSLVSGVSVNTQNTNIHNLMGRNNFSNEEDKIRKFSKNIKNVIKSKNFILINLFYLFTLIGTFSLFFEIKKSLSIYLLMISLFRLLSPFLANIFGGKSLSYFSLFLQFGILYLIKNSEHISQSQINVIVLISGISYGINSTIISSIIPKIYGYDLSYYLSGIIIVIGSFGFWCVFLINNFFLNKRNKIFLIYEIITLLAIGFLFLVDETPFDYKMRNFNLNEGNELQIEEDTKNLDAFSINDVKSERDA